MKSALNGALFWFTYSSPNYLLWRWHFPTAYYHQCNRWFRRFIFKILPVVDIKDLLQL